MIGTVPQVAPHIQLEHILGSGGFGKVYCGYDSKRQIAVAVKIISKKLVQQSGTEDYVAREIEILQRLNNPFIVRFLEAIETTSAYNIVLELAPNGELFDKIVHVERFTEFTARKYFQQLICALMYCHDRSIAHRDLKAENLLLAADNSLRLCDFGLSRYTAEEFSYNDDEIRFWSLAGSLDYQAPEILVEKGYNGLKTDMWACGCILFFMLCGYLPFTDQTDGLTKKRISTCQYNAKNQYLTPDASDVIRHLLDRNPDTRYTCRDVMKHPWFQIDLDSTLFPADAIVSPRRNDSPHNYITVAKSPTEMITDSPTSRLSFNTNEMISKEDIQGEGYLDAEGVRRVLTKLLGGRKVTDKELREFFSRYALTNEKSMTKEEFIIGWAEEMKKQGEKYDPRRVLNILRYKSREEFSESISDIFASIEIDKSSTTSKAMIKKLGVDYSDEEIQEMFDAVNPDHPGTEYITRKQFATLCFGYNLLREFREHKRFVLREKVFELNVSPSARTLSTVLTVFGNPLGIKLFLISKRRELCTNFEEDTSTGFLNGTYTNKEGEPLVKVGLRFSEFLPGYTNISVYRFDGKTLNFQNWFALLQKCMKKQIQQCLEDSAPKGESELL